MINTSNKSILNLKLQMSISSTKYFKTLLCLENVYVNNFRGF